MPRHRIPTLSLLLGALLITVGATVGCGQKGDLYLPEPQQESSRDSASD